MFYELFVPCYCEWACVAFCEIAGDFMCVFHDFGFSHFMSLVFEFSNQELNPFLEIFRLGLKKEVSVIYFVFCNGFRRMKKKILFYYHFCRFY